MKKARLNEKSLLSWLSVVAIPLVIVTIVLPESNAKEKQPIKTIETKTKSPLRYDGFYERRKGTKIGNLDGVSCTCVVMLSNGSLPCVLMCQTRENRWSGIMAITALAKGSLPYLIDLFGFISP